MNRIKLLVCLLVTPLLATALDRAVTYETTGGRFGDNLLSYMHGKWIAYKHNLPFLYRPFFYSNKLAMHTQELCYTKKTTKKFINLVPLGRNRSVQPHETDVLYLVPYFPESQWELANCIGYSGGPWDYLEVDWKDKGFIQELRRMIKPRKSIPQLNLPQDRVTVAIHMRRGGGYDPAHTADAFPLKFLFDSFFIEQIERLYHLLCKQPLYVYIFTDDHNPAAIKEKFKRDLKELDIEFVCREHNNTENNNVLEDFFALQQFDCLIHSESNYSLTASKLGEYMISIYPDSFYRKGEEVIYDHVSMTINHDHPKMAQVIQE